MCSQRADGFGDELLGVLPGDRGVLEASEDYLTGISHLGVFNFEQRSHRALLPDTLTRYLHALGYAVTGFCLRGRR